MLKQHTVVMLPTNEKAVIGEYAIMKNSAPGMDTYLSCGILHSEGFNMQCDKQHLYIIDESASIEEGDYGYDGQKIFLSKELYNDYTQGEFLDGSGSFIRSFIQGDNDRIYHKIIASTDPSLSLPSPSTAFIEKYCELGGIDEVMVEYYEHTVTFIDPPNGYLYGFPKVIPDKLKDTEDIAIKLGYPKEVADKYNGNFDCWYWDQTTKLLKVSSDNTITIKPVKDHYTRAEVFELLKQFALFKDSTFDQTDKNWINSMI